MGADPKTAPTKAVRDALWTAYQNQFPITNADGHTFEKANMGNWPLFTTPKAIASAQATGTYTPSANERGSTMMWIPNKNGDGYYMAPIKKGQVEGAFKAGAKPI